MTNKPLPEDVVKCMKECLLISRIPKRHKLDIENQRYLNADSIYTKIYRTINWRTDNSEKTETYITAIIHNTITLLEKYKDDEINYKIVKDHLIACKPGLIHLRDTYSYEPKVVIWIQVCIAQIENQEKSHHQKKE